MWHRRWLDAPAMNAAICIVPVLPDPVDNRWGDAPTSRALSSICTDDDIYGRELDRLFYADHWCYAGLECEAPQTGEFKRMQNGERSVILVRGEGSEIHVVENRCAQRGVAFCRERHGRGRSSPAPTTSGNTA